MLAGHSTSEGTGRFRSRFPTAEAAGFFRSAPDLEHLSISTIGIGTYLGRSDDKTDHEYTEALATGLLGGVNFIDTAINYRRQRSERATGAALARLFETGQLKRDEIIVCTKAGFMVPGAIPSNLPEDDIAGAIHCLSPEFLEDQVERSLQNLGLETIDVLYLHNPETQLGFVSRPEFERRISAAFECLERLVSEGKIRQYGVATWEGFRTRPNARERLSLTHLNELAQNRGGPRHHFRFIQLPFNMAMPEALIDRTENIGGQPLSVFEAAAQLGITAVASASLLQGRLTRTLPETIARTWPEPRTDAQRAIQFARSAPGLCVALVGMSQAGHVSEALGVAQFPPVEKSEYMRSIREWYELGRSAPMGA